MSRRSPAYLLVPLLLALFAPTARAQHRHADHDRDGDWMADCRHRSRDDRERFCEERVMGWRGAAGQALDVDAGPNGGVTVVGWDRDSVDVLVKVMAAAPDEAEAQEIARAVRITREGGTLRADGPATRRNRWWAVSYEIRAPRHSDLTLETINGPIEVEDISGRMQLDVVNGPISLDAVGGDVRARAQNGPLEVRLAGERWDGRGLDAETVNGPVVITVPSGYNAQLETGTRNGPMELGFPVTVQGRIGGGGMRRIETTLGSGGPLVRAVTTNGPAVLRRS